MNMELTGTFLGHTIPGVLFSGWGLWALWNVARAFAGKAPLASAQGPGGAATWPVSTSFAAAETWLKLVVPLAAGLGDLWWASWKLTDTSVMNYQHATAYFGFLLSGVADILARRGKVAAYVPHLVLAGALANAGFQFLGHGNHLPVVNAVHQYVIWIFMLTAVALVLELRYRHPLASLARVYLLLLQGAWFFEVAWILYRSGWDLSGMYNLMRVHLFFTWYVMGVLLLTAALLHFARRVVAVPATDAAIMAIPTATE